MKKIKSKTIMIIPVEDLIQVPYMFEQFEAINRKLVDR